jgi:hypothetical protein
MKINKKLIEVALPLAAINNACARIAAGRFGGRADSKHNIEEPGAPRPHGGTHARL